MNKNIAKYKEKYVGIKKRKIFIIILIICLISLILGILFLALLNKEGKLIVYNTIKNNIKNINSSTKTIINVLKNNIIITIIMWILGVSLFGIVFEILFLIIKSFSLGFSITSFIYTFKLKGIYIGLIYLIPSIFNLIIYIILGFFAANYSIYLFNYLFKNKEYNLKLIMKKYLKVLGISLILLTISSIIEIYLIPTIVKVFTKSLF